MMMNTLRFVSLTLLLVALAACGTEDGSTADDHAGHNHDTLVATAGDSKAGEELNPGGEQQLWTCGMHPQIVSEEPGQCPICGMDLVPLRQNGSAEGVVTIDPVTIQNIGVRTAPVTVESLGRSIRTTGRFEMDEQGERTISMKVSGWVETLHVAYDGARVRKGEPLLEIYSPELVSTQEEYLLAQRNAERLAGTAAAADAERLVAAARRRLAYWDLSEAQLQQLEEAGTPRRTLTFYAPSSGEVMRKQVSEGDYIAAGQPLMDIVDLSKVWLMVDVYEQDLGWVEVGTAARIELPYQPGRVYEGRVDYIYPMLDRETRTARARIILPGGHAMPFKPGMYATVALVGQESEPLPVVPEETLIRTGEREVIVLALGDGRFRPIEVTSGFQADGRVQILDGLTGGEQVVTSAQFLIDSEARLKSAVGAMVGGHNHDVSKGEGRRAKAGLGERSAETDLRTSHFDLPIDVYAADADGDGLVNQCEQTPHLLSDEPGAIDGCSGSVVNAPIGHAQTLLHESGYTNVPIHVAAADTNGDGRVWQSGMHWAVLKDSPGRCDICGMTLQEFTIAEAEQNLRDAGYQVTNAE